MSVYAFTWFIIPSGIAAVITVVGSLVWLTKREDYISETVTLLVLLGCVGNIVTWPLAVLTILCTEWRWAHYGY